MTPPPSLRDPGAQAERTLLAWTRTGIAQAAVGLLLLRFTAPRTPLALLLVLPLLVTAVALQVAARRRYGRLSAGSDEPAGRLLAAVTVSGVTTAAVCALTLLT